MKLQDIIGSKKRSHRGPRQPRLKQRSLHRVNLDESEARIQHIEDLILWSGSDGAKTALAKLRQLESNPQSATVKWDGSPAVIFGRNEDGEFVLTDKSGFGAKTYNGRVTSADDLAKMFMSRKTEPGKEQDKKDFVTRMANVWNTFEAATPANFRGYVHGDLLYFTTPQVKDNRLIFQPNTTMYSVDPKSDIGKQIASSTAGVVLHKFIDLNNTVSNVDASVFSSGDLLVMPPQTVTTSPELDVPELDRLDSFVSQKANTINKFLAVPDELKMKDFSKQLYNYINAKTKTGTLNNLGEDFDKWVDEANGISVGKKARMIKWTADNAEGASALWGFQKAVMSLKNKIINELDNHPADIEAYTGGKRGGEGYVIDKDVKLVNRDGFSNVNMTRER